MLIFDVPSTRSVKIMGTSYMRKPSRVAVYENGRLLGTAYTYDSAYATTGEVADMVGGIEHEGDGEIAIGHGYLLADLVVADAVLVDGILEPHAVAQAFGEELLGFGLDELVLQ